MDINQFSIYSIISTTEKNNSDDMRKILELSSSLEHFSDSSDVKAWLKDNWNIRDEVRNYAISSNVRMSVRNGKKYFNVTLEFDDEVKSYNYNK